MKRLAAIGYFCASVAWAQSGAAPVRFVEFAWPQVADAVGYELEFATTGGQPLARRVTTNAWQGELPVGTYKLRVRSQDSRGVPGKWGKPIPLVLAYPPVERVAPADAAQINGTDKTADVRFVWQAFATAARYRVEVKTDDGAKVAVKEVDGDAAVISLATAKRYQWAVIALLPDGTPGDAGKSERALTILGPQLRQPKLSAALKGSKPRVKWAGATGAASYRVKIEVESQTQAPAKSKTKAAKVWRTIYPEQETEARTVPLSPDWPSGRYRVRLIAMAPMRAESAPVELIFKREVAAAKAASVKAPPRQRFIARYTWLPHTRSIVLSGDRARIAVPSGVMNAHDLGLAWRWRPTKVSGLMAGADLDAIIIRSALFGEEQAATGSDQKELRADFVNTRAMLSMGYKVWYLGLSLDGGIERRQLGSLLPASLTAFDFAATRVSDPLAGVSLSALFAAERQVILTYLVAPGSTRGDLNNYRRTVTSLSYTHRIFAERLAMTYGIVSDDTQYDFVSADGDAYTQSWSEARFNLSVGYFF